MIKKESIIGWITGVLLFLIIGFWSYWGINEAFHEGWYYTSLLQNLSITFIQYLSIPIIFLFLSLIGFRYKHIGACLFIAFGIFALFFFNSIAGRFLIFIPLLLFALGFYFGEFRKEFSWFLIGLFLLMLCFGIPQLIRVENRFNDNDFGSKVVNGLTWASQGSGFPLEGTNWYSAMSNCSALGMRLPTVEELVSSMTRGNVNSGGIIIDGKAEYDIKPDKETPLWNPHSKVIYYWTNESEDSKAYLVAYNGYVLSRSKSLGANYQGYRCVEG